MPEVKTNVIFNFQLIKWQIHPKINKYHTEWFLVITDFAVFEEYMLFRSNILMGEYRKVKNKVLAGIDFHCSSRDELSVEVALTYNRRKNEKTVIDDCFCISDKLLSSYSHYFFDNGIIFITEQGAIRPLVGSDYEIIKQENRSVLVWPSQKYTSKDINIIRWLNGKHYYAKIGNIDVVGEGELKKWVDVKEAERQAKLFLDKINKEI